MVLKFGITGGTGSLGKKIISSNKNIKFIKFSDDIRKKSKVFKWIKKNKFDAIIHLAAVVPIKTVNSNKKKAYDVNYIGTKNLVDAIKSTDLEWIFFSSTSHVYKSSRKKISENFMKNPISYYGKTKFLAENYLINKLKKTNTRYCIGRIFSTSNSNQKKNYLVPDLIKKIKNSKRKIVLKNLNHYRDFISMDEISKIIFILYKKKYKGIINIGRGKGIYLKDIAKVICNEYEKQCEFKDNLKPTYLIADNTKLKKYYSLKKLNNLQKLIF